MSCDYTAIWPKYRLRYLLERSRTKEELRNLSSATEVNFVPMEAVGEYGGLDLSEIRESDSIGTGYTLFFEDDVLVAKITPCFENGKGALARNLTNGVGFGTTELRVLNPGPALAPEFLFYITISHAFRLAGEASMKGAAGQKRVPDEFIQNFVLALPPLEVQYRIADYLDREIAYIDALVAEKERLLALLEEKRAALVSRAVTRGVDADAPLRHSDLDWLGAIPAHWKIERAKNLFSVRDERSQTGEEELLTVSHLTGVTRRSEKEVNMFLAEDKASYKRCLPGDLAVNTLWAWMGAMGVSPIEGIVSPDYHVYEPKGDLLPEYIELLCRSKPFVAEVNRWSKGVWSSRLRLYPENFFEIRLPVPPKDEQVAIVREVQRTQARVSKIAGTLSRSIELARERRVALISAAVTGQIPPGEMTA